MQITTSNLSWAQRNPEKSAAYSKKYYAKNKEEIKAKEKEKRRLLNLALKTDLTALVEAVWENMTSGARDRKIEVKIDREYLKHLWEVSKGICQISGAQLVRERNSNYFPSIDRIDSSGCYEAGNVRFTAAMANISKNKHSDGEHFDMCLGTVITRCKNDPETYQMVLNKLKSALL